MASKISSANERLLTYAIRYCILCRTDMNKKENRNENNPVVVNNKFPVVQENDPDIANGPHIICKSCIVTLKADIMKMGREGKIDKDGKTVPVRCEVCRKIHQIELKYLKPILKVDDNACCAIL